MRNYLVVFVAVFFVFSIFGCSKKETSLEQMQEPMSMDTLTAMNTTATEGKPPALEAQTPAIQIAAPAGGESKLVPLPPAGPYKPAAKEIQAALKNAGYYTGAVDGKIGPKTKKAIEEFQKANGLKVDGKVGPKTWAILSKQSSPAVSVTPASKEKSVSLTIR
jgi:peptidoglycan hydrolase-like protein with peptidoglycan-binding domain